MTLTTTLVILTVLALGLSAGALLAEGAVLVPMWRAMAPDAFLAWYRENEQRLVRFFGPLEILAAVLAALATGAAWWSGHAPWGLLAGASGLAIAVLASFPLYFQSANAAFAEGRLEDEAVGPALRTWARWHGARVVVALAAFALAALAASR